MKRVSSCIFVRRNWYRDVILFPFALQTHSKSSVSITNSKTFTMMLFFCPHFFFSQQGKIRFYFVAKNLKVLLLNILSKQLQTFSFTQRSFTQYCQLLQTISSSPSKYCFALYCDTFKKLPKVTLENPPLRSVHTHLASESKNVIE